MNAMTKISTGMETMGHLSDEQIDDELLGELRGDAAAHLAECAQCTVRVAEAGAPIASFKEVTMAWSERRSATMPLPVVQVQSQWWARRAGWAMASVALAFGIAVAGPGNRVALLTGMQPAETPTMATEESAGAEPVAVEAKYDVPADRVTADNNMLKAIDSELNASVESPAVLGLEPADERPAGDDSPSLVEN